MYFIYTCRINLHIRGNGDYKKTEIERTVSWAFDSWVRPETLCDETNLVGVNWDRKTLVFKSQQRSSWCILQPQLTGHLLKREPSSCPWQQLPTLLTFTSWLISLVGRMFSNGPADLGSIPGCVMPKTLKMVPHTVLLNTQQYKVCIKGKVEQSRERSSALLYASV